MGIPQSPLEFREGWENGGRNGGGGSGNVPAVAPVSPAPPGVTDGSPWGCAALISPLSARGAESGQLRYPALSPMEALAAIPFPGTAPAPALHPKHGTLPLFHPLKTKQKKAPEPPLFQLPESHRKLGIHSTGR